MMFKLTDSLFVKMVFGTNSSKLQRLVKWNGSLAVFGMATVHTEVMIFEGVGVE